MNYLYIAVLVVLMSQAGVSQRRMVINNHDGTRSYFNLSTVDSVKFSSDALMVAVGGGSFTANTTRVDMSGFSIDKCEVTYELWTAVKTWGAAHGYTDLYAGYNGVSPVGSNNPVTGVSWYDIVKWCNARSEKDGLAPVYYTKSADTPPYVTRSGDSFDLLPDWTANGYRLPTEAEWEFAAGGGANSHGYIYSGSNSVGDVAWYDGNSGSATHTVGGKSANELGIYDMSGNVLEWCWDWYDDTDAYPVGGTTDPKGPTAAQRYRVVRGGSFYHDGSHCRSAVRSVDDPTVRRGLNGFRCVQD